MKPLLDKKQLMIAAGAVMLSVLVLIFASLWWYHSNKERINTHTVSPASSVRYSGPIYHVFFHSLVVYPELAYKNDGRGRLYETYMITQGQFEKILSDLYAEGFVLVDIHSIYTVRPDGSVERKELMLPKGKRPLILSIDDLNYYETMTGRGFAKKLVFDSRGNVATLITTPEGRDDVNRDGDVVPIVDDFVALHPEFSIDGAKGVIAVTGYDGILGYRTQQGSVDRDAEIRAVKPVVDRLKETGWVFASHSYSHGHQFVTGRITIEDVKKDEKRWSDEVEPLVGQTDIYIGPFGQVFGPNDPRQSYLRSLGFVMFCGVGSDHYLRYERDRVIMDREDMDGYRITKTPKKLEMYFDQGWSR